MESEYIMGGDSYCRKSTFLIADDLLRTTVTYVNTEEASLVDGYCERYVSGEWRHLNDIIPKEASIDNLKDMQINLIRSANNIITSKQKEIFNFDEFCDVHSSLIEDCPLFQWEDLEPAEEEKRENVIRLEFNPDKT
jgi:hypothetical protein